MLMHYFLNMEISLVPITPADFSKLISWAVSEEFLLQWTGRTFTYPLNEKQLRDYYNGSIGKSRLRLILKAIDTENGKHLGNITIDWANSKQNEAALTCIIVGEDAYKGIGAGEYIVSSACRIAFEELNKKKLYLNVFDFNLPAIRCYEKCSFREVLKENININGKEYVNLKMERSGS